MRVARLRVAVPLLVVWTAGAVAACDTYHVKLQAGDCVSASLAAVGCDDARAVQRVVDVVRREGGYPSCPPNLAVGTFTEGGEGPMIGVAVCLEPLKPPAPS